MSESVSSEYRALVAAGRIEPDPAQEALLPVLDRLRVRIEERAKASKTSALGWLFGRREAAEPARGLYLWGQVGRGKTMLMDLFFAVAAVRQKKRVHFHAFMADVHERIHAFRQAEKQVVRLPPRLQPRAQCGEPGRRPLGHVRRVPWCLRRRPDRAP